jgi:uncharacterized membrane protein
MVGSSFRYLGGAVGFSFGVVWMTVGLGSAIVCVLLAALGFGAVLATERARANPRGRRWADAGGRPLPLDRFEARGELTDDATTPLAAEAEYGWPSSFDALGAIETPEVARTTSV